MCIVLIKFKNVNVLNARMVEKHRDHMKDMLKGGLRWLCDKRQVNNGYMAKFEAR